MTGSASMPGLTPSAITELFRLIREKPHCVCKVSAYFVELYNDSLVDLFHVLDNKRRRGSVAIGDNVIGSSNITNNAINNNSSSTSTSIEPPKLEIKIDERKMVTIKNVVLKFVESPEELWNLFVQGNKERHVGATKMNAESSRSHSIFAIMVILTIDINYY